MSIEHLLDCAKDGNGKWKVNSRERTDLEFKEKLDQNSIRKCLKTIAAFANGKGGKIVFGVSNSPRYAIGVNNTLDEAEIQDLVLSSLYPVPEIEISDHPLDDFLIVQIEVAAHPKRPVIAIKDVQTKQQNNSTVLSQGVVYARRSGKTKPISGEEFGSILESRDNEIRNSIFSFLSRANEIGYENVAVADFRKYGNNKENVTLWLPATAAKDLNVIERAKLVQDNGADAYQIRGFVDLTLPSDKDPRKPLLPKKTARVLKEPITKIFGKWFPWNEQHLRKAAAHLGFWEHRRGDNKNTGYEPNTERPLYFEAGRAAIQRFANRNPDDFVDVVGSVQTKQNGTTRRTNRLQAQICICAESRRSRRASAEPTPRSALWRGTVANPLRVGMAGIKREEPC
ncbi:MAG: ATP-binding protein [Pseudomonadota bacterium]